MGIGRVVGLLVLIVVLYAIITQPVTSAATTRSLGATLGAAAESFGTFVSSLAGGVTSGSSSAELERTATSSGTYRVRPGDTLSSIAAAHGTTAAALARRNGISDPDHITTGQRLVVD